MAHRDIVAAKYWNTNGVPVAIVAVEGGASDVAAYIGGDPNPHASEGETYRWIAGNGAKLSREEAYAFLPALRKIALSYRD